MLLLVVLLRTGECTSSYSNYFERDGFIVMRRVFTEDSLAEWMNFGNKYFLEVFEQLNKNGHTQFPEHSREVKPGVREYALGQGKTNGFLEVVMRSGGRYDLSLMHDNFGGEYRPSISPIVDKLSSVATTLLHSDMNDININLALVVSTPGAKEQQWHSDGEHLDMEHHLPCHCFNIFIPLVNVTDDLGPTEIFPASHIATRKPAPMTFAPGELKAPVAPTLNVGDILLFDYRVLHRGRPNLSGLNRPVLVLIVSQPWYKDVHNYPNRSLTETK